MSQPVEVDPLERIKAAQERLQRAAVRGGLENDPLGECFAALSDCLGVMGDVQVRMGEGGARGLTKEGEAELVHRVGREVKASVPIWSRALSMRASLVGALLGGLLVLAATGVGYGVGRSGEPRISSVCQGAALQKKPEGVVCAFWWIKTADVKQ